MFAPVRVGREVSLRRVQLREEGEPLQASSSDLGRVDCLRPPDTLPEIFPIVCGSTVEFRHVGFRIERAVNTFQLC